MHNESEPVEPWQETWAEADSMLEHWVRYPVGISPAQRKAVKLMLADRKQLLKRIEELGASMRCCDCGKPMHMICPECSCEHGVTCPKAAHHGDGYLHAADDDSVYVVDGVSYCGRCHTYLPRKESQ